MVADIIGYDVKGNPTLTVEIKNKKGTDENWAAQMRRNMLAHGTLPKTDFFLLALPDNFYLWKDNDSSTVLIKPNYTVNPNSFLSDYYNQFSELSKESFELVVTNLLSDILHAHNINDLRISNKEWLVKSGLFESIKGGHLVSEGKHFHV